MSFEDNIVYANYYLDSATTTNFLVANTYKDIDLTGLNTYKENNISFNSTKDNFVTQNTGVFLVQFRATWRGGSNDVYTMQMTLNGGAVNKSQVQYSTKGSNFWEVQNLFIVNAPLHSIDDQGYGTSKNTFAFQVKNNNDTTSAYLENLSLVIFKIG